MTAVGFVGFGAMGRPMVGRLLDAGGDVAVHARRAEVRAELAAAGAVVRLSPAELAADRDVVVVCVFDDAQLLDVAAGADGLLSSMRSGSVLVSHTTGSPATIRHLADLAAGRGVLVLDAPVSGDPAHIPAGRLTVIVGGEATAIDVARPVLEAYSDRIVPVGGVGAAMAVKLVNNLLMAANLQLGQQALLVAKALGADTEAMRAVIPVSSGASYGFDVAAQFDSVERLTELAAPYLRKDVDLALQVMSGLEVSPGILATTADGGPVDLGPPFDSANPRSLS